MQYSRVQYSRVEYTDAGIFTPLAFHVGLGPLQHNQGYSVIAVQCPQSLHLSTLTQWSSVQCINYLVKYSADSARKESNLVYFSTV